MPRQTENYFVYSVVMRKDAKSTLRSNTEVFLTFRLFVRASHLWIAPYSEYQQFLYDTNTDLREKA